MTLREIWCRMVKTRYTRALEAEVARLRTENRALLNSILGIAGIPPIVVESADLLRRITVDGETETGIRATNSGGAAAVPARQTQTTRSRSQHRMAGVPAPVRHRSWQQVNRMLELEAMRKREQGPVARTQDRVE